MKNYKNAIQDNFEKIRKGWSDKDNKKLHAEYNEFCEKTFERYNYYNDKAELTSDSYGYDYTDNEYGIETSYKYCVYNETNKTFNDVRSERSYTYSDNFMLTNETYISHSSNEKISLDYFYDSNNLLESQIRTDYDGDTVDYKVKYVFDYENNKTTEYEFKNGNWEVSNSYNYITKLDCNPYK